MVDAQMPDSLAGSPSRPPQDGKAAKLQETEDVPLGGFGHGEQAPEDAAGSGEEEMTDGAPPLGSRGGDQTLLHPVGTTGTENINIKEGNIAASSGDDQPPSPADEKTVTEFGVTDKSKETPLGGIDTKGSQSLVASNNVGDQSSSMASSSAGPFQTLTPKAEAAQKSSGSQYKMIAGVRYDRNLLEQAEEAAKDSRISIAEAKQLWQMAMDGDRVTDVERRTLEHIANEMKCTAPASSFLRKKIAEEQKTAQALD